MIDTTGMVGDDIRHLLTDEGYRLRSTATRSAGLSLVRDHRYDAILLCHAVDTLAGVVRQIRTLTSTTPVILLLPPEHLDAVLQGLEEGATGYGVLERGAQTLLMYEINRQIQSSDGRGVKGSEHRTERDKNEKNRKIKKNKENEKNQKNEKNEKYEKTASKQTKRPPKSKAVPATINERLRALIADQQAGFRVQRRMMPDAPCTLGDVELDHRIYPSLILTGDFVDYFPLPDGRVLFYLADVSGHGASSAFVTVLLKNLSRHLEREFSELNLTGTGTILKWMNEELLLGELEHHLTLFLGIVDREAATLEYSNAAHFPAAILSGGGRTRYLEAGGRPLGLFKRVSYPTRRVTLPESWRLVLFSDGVLEIMPQITLKDKESHLLSLIECGVENVDALAEGLGMEETSGLPDDVAVLTVCVNSQEPGPTGTAVRSRRQKMDKR